MTEGVLQTKDTRLYFGYTPDTSSGAPQEVHAVACPTGIPEFSAGAKPRQDQTCLSSRTRQYYDGLADPPELSIPINFIPRSEAHQALIDAKARGSALVMPWLVSMIDSQTAPTTFDSDGYFVSPGPTTIGFKAYVSNFTVGAAVGEIWKGTLTIQLQLDDTDEDLHWDLPTADLA